MKDHNIHIGPYQLDLVKNCLHISTESEAHLAQKSCEVLRILALSQGSLVSRDSLIDFVWDGNYLLGEKRLPDEIWRIRRALSSFGAKGVSIKTLPRKGYMLLVDPGQFELPPREEPLSIGNRQAGKFHTGAITGSGRNHFFVSLISVLVLAFIFSNQTGRTQDLLLDKETGQSNGEFVDQAAAASFFVGLLNSSEKLSHGSEEIQFRQELLQKAEDQLASYTGDQETYALLLHSMADLYFAHGLFDNAEQYVIKSLSIKSQFPGRQSIEYFDGLLLLSKIQRASLRPGDSRDSGLLALQIALDNDFQELEIARVYSELGLTFMRYLGDYQIAGRYLRQALELRQSNLGKLNKLVANSLENLGYLYTVTNRNTEALAMYEQAHDVVEEINGPGSRSATRLKSNIADLLIRMGSYQSAIEIAQVVEGLYANGQGEYQFGRGANLITLAEAYLKTDQASRAMGLAVRGTEILSRDSSKHGRSAKHIGYAYMVLGDVSDSLGNDELAADYFQKCILSFETIFGANHPNTIAAVTRLEEFSFTN